MRRLAGILWLALLSPAWGQVRVVVSQAPPAPLANAAAPAPVASLALTAPSVSVVPLLSGTLAAADPALRPRPSVQPHPAAAKIATALRAAGVPAAAPTASLERLTSLFDGLSREHKDRTIAHLESAVREGPKDKPLRLAFQDLVVRDELSVVEPKLRGPPLTEARRADVLGKTRFWDVRWWQYLTRAGDFPTAEGRASEDLGIHMHVKAGWPRLPGVANHLRVLFSHEYAHRLQFEKEGTLRYGGEVPAVATELLRAIELVGLDALAKGAIRFIGSGVLDMFQYGREWAVRAPEARKDAIGFHYKGFLAGAAYGIAQRTGHWADAWGFLRRVNGGQEPDAAEAAILSGR